MENKMNIRFSPPDVGEAEIEEVIDAIKSGWITTGPKTKLFEQKITELCKTEKTVCLNSSTNSKNALFSPVLIALPFRIKSIPNSVSESNRWIPTHPFTRSSIVLILVEPQLGHFASSVPNTAVHFPQRFDVPTT